MTSAPLPGPVIDAPQHAASGAQSLWWRRGWGAVAAGSGALTLAGGTAYLWSHDPNVPGTYPACVLLEATGLYCPACGGTRATYDLLHGNVAAAFGHNPLVPLLVVVALVWLGRRLRRAERTRRGLSVRAPRSWPTWAPIARGAAFLLFGVLRNLPGLSWLAPA